MACVIDQGSITKRKALGGVPCGRITPGQQVHIFSVTELDLRTRKTTGRSYLRIFGRHTAEVFKKIICCLVELGVPPDVAQGIADDRTPVWLDDHPSYSFFALLEHNGYDVVRVSHQNRVFRNNDAQGSTSNAAEGEVSRYKAFFKAYNLRVPRDGDYGLYLAEFMWRRAQLSEAAGVPERRWRDFAFWRIVSSFGEVGKAELVKLQAGGRRRELWVPEPGVLAQVVQLVPWLHVGINKPIIPAAIVLGLHRPDAGRELSEDVAKLLFEYEAVLDAEPPAGYQSPGRPRGRGRGGRGGAGRGGRGRGRAQAALQGNRAAVPIADQDVDDERLMAGGELAPLLKETRRQARNIMPGTKINLPVALTRPTRREIHMIISLLSPPTGYEYQHWSEGQPPHRQLSISLVAAAPVVVADAAGPVPVAAAAAQVVVADAAVLPAARPKGRPRSRLAAALAPTGPGPSAPVYGSAGHFAQNR